jgi:8-oxo-dGTP pyrophosphatase MutT (NUDIX family)
MVGEVGDIKKSINRIWTISTLRSILIQLIIVGLSSLVNVNGFLSIRKQPPKLAVRHFSLYHSMNRVTWYTSKATSTTTKIANIWNNRNSFFPHRIHFSSQLTQLFQIQQSFSKNSDDTQEMKSVLSINQQQQYQYSLVGPFLLIVHNNRNKYDIISNDNRIVYRWLLLPIDSSVSTDKQIIPESYQSSEGSKSWAALHNCHLIPNQSILSNSIHLTATFEDIVDDENESITTLRISTNSIELDATSKRIETDLLIIVSRVMVQWVAAQYSSHFHHHRHESNCNKIKVSFQLFSNDDSEVDTLWFPSIGSLFLGTNLDANDIREKYIKLFPWYDITPSTEIVEIVDRTGASLACLPRKLVHKHNILHKGIGIFVTKKEPIILRNIVNNCNNDQSNARANESYDDGIQPQQPSLYVHQRSADKSIFPSLYDMFVGGVSLANEDAVVTAQREVAEELGLSRALLYSTADASNLKMSNNKLMGPILRCIVCTAYNRCVVQLFSYRTDPDEIKDIKHQEEEVQWGSFIPYKDICYAADQSIIRLYNNNQWPGTIPPIQSSVSANRCNSNLVSAPTVLDSYDFVPDGLLVWEAWLRYSE